MSISRDCMGFPPSDENTKNYFQNAPTSPQTLVLFSDASITSVQVFNQRNATHLLPNFTITTYYTSIMLRFNILAIALIIACANALTTTSVRKSINSITKDTFATVTAEVEPFLLNDAGVTFYNKSIRRISTKAKAFGIELSPEFGKAAKATEKRREKQNAFVQVKITEAADAAAAAVEEAAAAAEAAAAEAVAATEAAAAEAASAAEAVAAPDAETPAEE